MSLAIVEQYLKFAESAVLVKSQLPSGIDPDELENALVNYGVVLLHSHMEQCFKNALAARCNRCADREILAFALSIKDEKAGKIGLDSVKETLGKFSSAYKKKFKEDLLKYGGADSWDSVKNQRATVAHHGQPATCSLADLRQYYEDVRWILGILCDGLDLGASEILGISTLIQNAKVSATLSSSPMA